MKVLVIHNGRGKIEGLAVPGPAVVGQIQMVPRKGRQVTEVDVEDIRGDVLSSENQQRLLGIVEGCRLEFGPGGARLVPRG
ncbi:MAG TPA: hypothetical protein VF516_41360 [Kofleriaceae bacterium]